MVTMMFVFLAVEQPRVRFALQVLLMQQPGLVVVGEAASVEELLDQVRESHPGLVLLLDWGLSGLTANISLSLFREACPDVFIIVLGGQEDQYKAAMGAGADAFVSMVNPPDQLLAALKDLRQRTQKRPKIDPGSSLEAGITCTAH
jgi:DNA-binding NarL/FixJ family response regulator